MHPETHREPSARREAFWRLTRLASRSAEAVGLDTRRRCDAPAGAHSVTNGARSYTK